MADRPQGLSLVVSARERGTLERIAEESGGGESARGMLEGFVADLCAPGRGAGYVARVWLAMRRRELERKGCGIKEGGAA